MQRINRDDAVRALRAEREALPERFGGCAMCALAARWPAGAEGVETLAENGAAVAVLDRFAAGRGHVLVVLRAHVERVAEVPWEDYALAQRLAWEASRAVERALAPRRVFVAALGSADPLPQSYPHHHVHVIPVYESGEGARPASVLSWSEGVWAYEPGEARAVADALRGRW